MAWAACQLDLQLSWVFWERLSEEETKMHVREIGRGEALQTTLIDLHPLLFPLFAMCMDPDPEDRACDVIESS